MRRLFGTIGLTYLTVLTAAFYWDNALVWALLTAVGGGIGAVGLALTLKKRRKGVGILVSGVTVLAAMLSIFLYQNIHYLPIARQYSDKEISFRGYLADEVVRSGKSVQIPLVTEEVDGEPVRLKIHLTVYWEGQEDAFDVVEGRLRTVANKNDNQISKGFFLSAYQDEVYQMTATGERHVTPYQTAVWLRREMKKALDNQLSPDSAALCKAILLGDKYELGRELKHDFQRTGTSFLIVVSGMHLSVICAVLVFLLRGMRLPRLPSVIVIAVAVVSFAALSGFTRSVIRAGIMCVLAHGGGLFRRRSDSLNSLGIAALLLSVCNPYVVGDMGVIMSFTTTLGIVLWAPALIKYADDRLHMNNLRPRIVQPPLRFLINLTAVSVSAALWIYPITALFFGELSPLVIPVSILTSPLACLILIVALALQLLAAVPFLSFLTSPLAAALDFLCKLHLQLNAFFAGIPIAKVRVGPALAVWLAAGCLLIAVGYLIHARKRYILIAAAASLLLLTGGLAVQTWMSPHDTEVYLNKTAKGLTVSVSHDDRLSLLCCGGTNEYNSVVIDELYTHGSRADYLIIPNRVNYSAYREVITRRFRPPTVLTNAVTADALGLTDAVIVQERSETTYTLSDTTEDTVIAEGDILFQYLTVGRSTLLFVPHYADIQTLPEKYRTADVVIMDFVCDHAELLHCDTLVYTGMQNRRYEKHRETLEEISQEIILVYKDSFRLRFQE